MSETEPTLLSPEDAHAPQRVVWALLSAFREHETQSVHLLIDPTLRPPEADSPLGEWLAGTEVRRVSIGHDSFNDTNSPLLARFDPGIPAHIDFLWTLVEEAFQEAEPLPLLEGKGRRICAFVSASCPLPQLVYHLGAVALQFPPEGGCAFLRYYDPAVWPALWHQLDPAQRAILCGPANHWFCLTRNGWCDHANPQPPGGAHTALGLTAAQWNSLADLGLVNTLDHTLALDAWPRPTDFDQRAHNAIQWARQRGFSRDTEVQACAEHLLRYGNAFREHPRIRHLLQNAEPGTSFFALIATLTDADWAQIRAPSLADNETRQIRK